MKQTALKRTKAPNHYSLKRIAELNAEAPIRRKLIVRCHGIPLEYVEVTYHKGVRYTINRVVCIGGYCECGCGRWAGNSQRLSPHEKHFRSRGGKLSLENSLMVFDECHAKLQDNDVRLKWL